MLIVRLCVFCDDLCLIELIVVLIRLSVKQSKGKKVKDPNKPKRAPSAFFVFMYVFLIFCISVFIWLLSVSVLVLDRLLCRRIYLCNICVCVCLIFVGRVLGSSLRKKTLMLRELLR